MDGTFQRRAAKGGASRRLVACTLWLLALSAAAWPAEAAQLRFFHMVGPDIAVYRLEGSYLPDDAARFRPVIDAAATRSKYVLVQLESPGGDLIAAIEIGRMIRHHLFWTQVVDLGSGCYSACVLVLAAGAMRMAFAESKVGIHRPRFDAAYFAQLDAESARRRYASMAGSVRSYLDEMGIAPRLFDMMMQVSSSGVRLLTQDELEETGLDGTDPAYDEWMNARQNSR